MTEAILDAMISEPSTGVDLVSLDAATARTASLMAWDHRDPFDRMIAATAIAQRLEIVSKDVIFDDVETVKRIWD